MLLLLSLSVTLTATSSSAQPDQRSIVLTVRIVDNRSEIVSGAHIIVYQGDIKLGEGESDANGLARMRIAVNTDKPVQLVIEVSKSGMETNPYVLKLGTEFPDRPPVTEITLQPGVSRPTVELTVKVVEQGSNGTKPIQTARVNAYLGTFFFGSDSYVRPPDLREDTNAGGIAKFAIPVRASQDLDLTLEVSREDKQTLRKSIKLFKDVLTHAETFELSPRAGDSGGDYPSVNIKVNVEDEQGNNLEGALVALTSSALTDSQRNTPHQRSTGPDGSATVGIELMSSDPVEYIGITVSKPGYKKSSRNLVTR